MHEQIAVGMSCRELEHTAELRRVGVTHWADHRQTQCPEALVAAVPGLIYMWNPAPDDGNPKPISWYAATVVFVRDAVASNPHGLAVVTCARGQHRGPSMAYAALRAVYALPRRQALRALARAWPSGDPWYADDIDAKLESIVRSL